MCYSQFFESKFLEEQYWREWQENIKIISYQSKKIDTILHSVLLTIIKRQLNKYFKYVDELTSLKLN